MTATENISPTTAQEQYRGETLDELRLRRAMVAVKLDFQKEALQQKIQQVAGNGLKGGSVLSFFTGGADGKHPVLHYFMTGLKVVRVAYSIFRLFRRKK